MKLGVLKSAVTVSETSDDSEEFDDTRASSKTPHHSKMMS